MSPARRPASTRSGSARGKQQYHHAIPRFILRRFVEGPKKSKAQRKKEYKRTGVDPDYVLFYDVAERELKSRSIGEIYGVMSLYSDKFAAADFNELEKKFSRLEQDAAGIIEAIHTTGRSGEVVMKRKELETLRKFLFLQHYRRGNISLSYFDPDNPENANVRSWIKRYMQKHKLPSHRDVWIHVLRYYLDTSHTQINMHAEEIYQKYGLIEVHGLMMSRAGSEIDPDMEHFPALAYQKQAGMFFLCIWEAAEGQEFILTSHGFGIWEGLLAGEPEAHRIFVISPRHAIVLRSNFTDSAATRGLKLPLSSDFEDVVHERPVCSRTIVYDTPAAMEAYRASARAADDRFTFKVTRLTPKQTFAMNSVHLVNLPDKGSMTFLSRECMLRTLRNHLNSFLHVQDVPRYLPLVHHLSPPDLSKNIHENLYVTLMRISLGYCHEVSEYEQAVAVMDLLGREQRPVTLFATEHTQLTSAAIEYCKSHLHLSRAGKQKASDSFEIVTTLPSNKSRDLFHAMFSFLGDLNLKRSTDPLDALQNNMMVIAVLRWAASDGEAFARMEKANESLGKVLKDLRVTCNIPSDESSGSSSADDLLLLTIREIEDGTAKYKTEYDKARAVYQICSREEASNPFSSECKRLTQLIIERFNKLLKPPRAGFQSRPEAKLVKELPEHDSELLLAVIGNFLEKMGYPDLGAKGDLLITLSRQCVGIGFLTWLARNRFDVLETLCNGIQVVQN